MITGQTAYERYRAEIYRIGWRIQYKAKKIRNRELPLLEHEPIKEDFTVASDQALTLEQLLDTLPDTGQRVLHKLYWEGLTEAEVARQLKISQQAVNQWKRKMLKQLSQKLTSNN
ncbi:RNA polymerase sigma factor [Paenibacillus sp. FSL K6-1230]|uniref:RNA polymerase sigma factor n=1 Tax=Paenibacillus sp. FSL K6-1230 TaxID=2921603 RepID=UPI0030F8C434